VTAGLLAIASPSVAQIVVDPTFFVASGIFGQPNPHLQDVDVAAGADGSFIVVWGDYSLSYSTPSFRPNHAGSRRFDATGRPLGPPIQIDTGGWVYIPRINPDRHGGFITVWDANNTPTGRILDATGAPTGTDIEIITNVGGANFALSMTAAALPSGPVFTWSDSYTFWLRRLDASGDRHGGDIAVDENTYEADAANLPDGGIASVWSSSGGPSVLRIFSPAGLPGPKVPVGAFRSPRVAASPLGGVAVVGALSTPAGTELWGRFHDDEGSPLGDEFHIHTAPPSWIYFDAEFDARGNLYVAWSELQGDGSTRLPMARSLDAGGAARGDAVVLSQQPASKVRLARLTTGELVNVWYAAGQAFGAISRTCAAPCGDGIVDPTCEPCDDGSANSDTTPGACRTSCLLPRCGDAVTDPGEECDDGNHQRCDGCAPDCRIEVGVACGDGVHAVQCGEPCDDGPGNAFAPDACRPGCVLPACGDGITDGTEECDDGNARSCDGCSFDCRVEAAMPDGDGNGVADSCDVCAEFVRRAHTPGEVCSPQPIDGLTAEQAARFQAGLEEFLEVEAPASGLGPVFNGAACAECHNHPTTGGSSTRFVQRIGFLPTASASSFDPLLELGGSLLQEQGVSTATCTVAGEVVPPEANVVGRRDTPPLFGLGLIEAIDRYDIKKRADLNDRNNDGISGRYRERNGQLGRFGWKAQLPTLHDFGAEAYLDEMGITTPFHPEEHRPQGGSLVCDERPDPEDDGMAVTAFTDFMLFLSPPSPPKPPREVRRETRLGRQLFRKIQCEKCHFSKYRTARDFPIAALAGRRRLPIWSDLLLHNMGPDLDDGIVHGGVGGAEWRTPPLWGVRYTAPYLHDGRAATLEEAITLHGGEAQQSRDLFLSLSPASRAEVLKFLGSL
jgi:cysteine-rich repeat protein